MSTTSERPLVQFLHEKIARLTPPKSVADIAQEAGLKPQTLDAVLVGDAHLALQHVSELARVIGDYDGELLRICFRDWKVAPLAASEDLHLSSEECALLLRVRERLAGKALKVDDELLAWIDGMPASS